MGLRGQLEAHPMARCFFCGTTEEPLARFPVLPPAGAPWLDCYYLCLQHIHHFTLMKNKPQEKAEQLSLL